MSAAHNQLDAKPQRIGLAAAVSLHVVAIAALLSTAAGKAVPQPELHLRADRTTQYQAIADVMAAAARAGVQRIGFVSDPGSSR